MKIKWNYNYEDAEGIAKQFNISETIAEILNKRFQGNIKKIEEFINAKDRKLYPAKLFKNIDSASNRILRAIKNEEKIVIYGDYDVDGTTSTAILYDAFNKLGAVGLDYYIPHRKKEGYGLNTEAVKKLAEEFELMVTVDLGVTAKKEVELANELGMEIIVTDHHKIKEKEFPSDAYAVINPKLGGYPFSEISGCVVALKLAERVYQIDKNDDDFRFLNHYLDLTTISIIADRVPLIDENRTIVKKQLPKLYETGNVGLYTLLDKVGKTKGDIVSTDVGFVIGPRINACGRMSKADIAVDLFTTKDSLLASQIVDKMEKLNNERKKIVDNQEEKAMEIIENKKLYENKVIIVSDDSFDASLAGIVASRIVGKYYRPTIVIGLKDDSGKGSARSIEGVSIFEGLKKSEEFIEEFGGHNMAAGLSVSKDDLNDLNNSLNNWAEDLEPELFVPKIEVDSQVPLYENSLALIEELDILRPFGEANPEPKLQTSNLEIGDIQYLGNKKKHVKLTLKHKSMVKKALWWSSSEWVKDNVETKDDLSQYRVDVVYKPMVNTFRGNTSVQLDIEDLKIKKAPKIKKIKEEPVDEFLDELFDNVEEIRKASYYRGLSKEGSFNTKVVGVTFEGRQDIIKELKAGDRLKIERDPENEYDKNAIKVISENGQIGFLNRDMAKELAPAIDKGVKYNAEVTEVTGKDRETENLGVNIYIEKEDFSTSGTEEVKFDAEQTRKRLKEMKSSKLRTALKNEFIGHYDLHNKQKHSIATLEKAQNLLTVMGTGRGKSVIFQLYAAFKAIKYNQTSLFIYPLRALINDQLITLKDKLGDLGINVWQASGNLNRKDKEKLFKALKDQKPDIILATPEFVEYHMDKFNDLNIGFMVVDEAHHVDDSHRATYTKIDKLKKDLGSPQIFACTATANEKVATKIKKQLDIDKTIIDSTQKKNIKLIDNRGCKTPQKLVYLIKLINRGEKTVVYFNSKKKATELAQKLQERFAYKKDIRVGFYHSDLTNKEREEVEQYFKEGEITTLFSTSAFGEGVNIRDIKHIVLYHLNFNATDFAQQTGRAGRDGNKAYIHLLFNKNDIRVNSFILKLKSPDKEKLKKITNVIFKIANKKANPFCVTLKKLKQIIVDNSNISYNNLSTDEIEATLEILEELGLIEIVQVRDDFHIKVVKKDKKISLAKSITYLEGQKDISEFVSFKDYIFTAEKEELLNIITKPIVPEEEKVV